MCKNIILFNNQLFKLYSYIANHSDQSNIKKGNYFTLENKNKKNFNKNK